jgi:aspartyl-tRNA(Asn)/glutamyl-tRNA(Gln) amidotransferase subunit A
MSDLSLLTIKEARVLLDKGEISAEELFRAVHVSAEKQNDAIKAYIEFFDDAEEHAKRADARIKEGKQHALTGIPLAVKDNILIKGHTASAASKILSTYRASYDAGVVEKLKQSNAVFVGRTNMDEFAMGSSTENSSWGITCNPKDHARVPGGSSGGSAAAVAMNGALGALGSDTGGSIRQPAAFCGVVGLKPTYGSVSRSGLMAMASSLDQIGPFAKTVGDAQIIFDGIKGYDAMDSTSHPHPQYLSPKGKPVIGIPEDFVNAEGVDKDVIENFHRNIELLKARGYTIKTISLPALKHALSAYYIIMPAEVSSNLARYDGLRYGVHSGGEDVLASYTKSRGEGFGRETRRRILLGTFVLSSGYYDAYYRKAIGVQRMIRQAFIDAFKDVGIIALPTTPTPAFKIGEKSSDPLQMYLADIFTVPINLAGVPALSVPCGTVVRDGSNLPLGLQLVGPMFSENILFSTGEDVENAQAEVQ